MNERQHQKWRAYFDTKAAGKYTDYSPRTLEKLRWSGGGPAYYRHNGIRYLKEDLDEWLESGRRTSTSDPGPNSERPHRPTRELEGQESLRTPGALKRRGSE